jgi:hypothetical protein
MLIVAIKFRMEQEGLSATDMQPHVTGKPTGRFIDKRFRSPTTHSQRPSLGRLGWLGPGAGQKQ